MSNPVDRVLNELEPEVLEMIQGIVRAIEEEIGESEEAWRGVDAMSQVIATIGYQRYQQGDAIAILGLVVGALRRSPRSSSAGGLCPDSASDQHQRKEPT